MKLFNQFMFVSRTHELVIFLWKMLSMTWKWYWKMMKLNLILWIGSIRVFPSKIYKSKGDGVDKKCDGRVKEGESPTKSLSNVRTNSEIILLRVKLGIELVQSGVPLLSFKTRGTPSKRFSYSPFIYQNWDQYTVFVKFQFSSLLNTGYTNNFFLIGQMILSIMGILSVEYE